MNLCDHILTDGVMVHHRLGGNVNLATYQAIKREIAPCIYDPLKSMHWHHDEIICVCNGEHQQSLVLFVCKWIRE